MQIQFAQNKMLKYLICEIKKKKHKKKTQQNKKQKNPQKKTKIQY